MNYSLKELDVEVQKKIDELIDNGGVASKAWIVTGVLADHQDIQGSDEMFARCCMGFAVSERVSARIRTVKKEEEEPTADPLLPGFDRIQKRYNIERDGERKLVSPYSMTYEEIQKKAEELRGMAKGLEQHADQLIEFAAANVKAM